jgi:hypothetical protein
LENGGFGAVAEEDDDKVDVDDAVVTAGKTVEADD